MEKGTTDTGSHKKLKKTRKLILPQSLQKKYNPAKPLMIVQGDQVGFLTYRTIR